MKRDGAIKEKSDTTAAVRDERSRCGYLFPGFALDKSLSFCDRSDMAAILWRNTDLNQEIVHP